MKLWSDWFLLRPYWLFAVPLIFLSYLALRRRGTAGVWQEVIDPVLLPILLKLGVITGSGVKAQSALPFAAAGMVVLGLLGPSLPKEGQIAFRPTDPLVLILDLSPSIVADEAGLNGLKTAAARLLSATDARPIGLMVYGADAYLASAPTTDRDTILSLIGVIDRDTLPVAGSRPDLALSMARDLFANGDGARLIGADLVVLSDGGGTGVRASEEAARLANDGAQLWAMVLPKVASAPPVDPAGLYDLAKQGGGSAYLETEAAALGAAIRSSRDARMARVEALGHGYRDFGPWLLLAAMALVLPLFRRQR